MSISGLFYDALQGPPVLLPAAQPLGHAVSPDLSDALTELSLGLLQSRMAHSKTKLRGQESEIRRGQVESWEIKAVTQCEISTTADITGPPDQQWSPSMEVFPMYCHTFGRYEMELILQ